MNDKEFFDESINKAVKRYSSLFTLPSLKVILGLIMLLCAGCGVFSTFLLNPTLQGLLFGIIIGIILFLITFISDMVVDKIFLRNDLVYEMRRCLGLSIFSLAVWLAFILLSNGLALLFRITTLFRLWLLGFSAAVILRLTVLNATSVASHWRRIISAFFTPSVALMLFFYTWTYMGNTLNLGAWGYLAATIPLSIVAVYAFTYSLNKIGVEKLGFSSFALFKAFLINWIEGTNTPLENIFEKLGTERNVKISILKFETSSEKIMLVIPQVHPGPFKNVGSSLLPSKLQEALEKKFKYVAVPHGLLGHEFDVSSSSHVERIIEKVVDASNFSPTASLATPLTHTTCGPATVFCQIFGDCAVLSLTLAPKTTEDLPQALGSYALKEAKKYGLSHVIVINAHNSLDGTVSIKENMELFRKAITENLKETSSLKRLPFKVGAAKIIPTEFGLEDGMGPGGITAVTVEVGNQKFAYVTIDGNNMVSGLREKILSMFRDLGVDSGEVFTTDTHAVTAVVLTSRGYHALGEVIPHEKLINYVRETVEKALMDMKPAKVGYKVTTVPNVKVIGEKQIIELCSLIDPALKRAKHMAVPLFLATGLLLVFLLVWLL